jgi:AGZA family xanthine/uracil permease-like MFS transporter
VITRYFELDTYHSSVRTDVLAGITTFLSAMYVIVVNPSILSATGMPFGAVLTATVIVCSFCTVMMGLYANNPILVAPGMGINAFFTFSVVLGMGVKWETALGSVFWSGVVFLLLSVFNVRTYIIRAIPKQLRHAIAAGIGLFIALIGCASAKFIVPNPATMIGLAKLDPTIVTFLVGMIITSFFVIKRTMGALILGIIATTVLALPIGRLYGDASSVNAGVPTLFRRFSRSCSSPSPIQSHTGSSGDS